MTTLTKDIFENIDFNEEGFMTNPDQWNEEIAVALAEKEGIDVLTPEHWEIIEFCRQSAEDSGAAPTLRQITKGTSIDTKRLFKLFPKGPAKRSPRSPA